MISEPESDEEEPMELANPVELHKRPYFGVEAAYYGLQMMDASADGEVLNYRIFVEYFYIKIHFSGTTWASGHSSQRRCFSLLPACRSRSTCRRSLRWPAAPSSRQ